MPGKTAGVTIEADAYQITVSDGVAITAPRKPSDPARDTQSRAHFFESFS
jgi:hypothetical protein